MPSYTPRFPGDVAPGKYRIGMNPDTATFYDNVTNTSGPSDRMALAETNIPTRYGTKPGAPVGQNIGLARIYFGDLGSVSTSSIVTACQGHVNKGRIPWFSLHSKPFSGRPATDAQALLTALRSVVYPTGHPNAGAAADVWFTLNHEPEGDDVDADYAPQQVWFRGQMNTNGVTNVAFCPVFTYGTLFDGFQTGTAGARGRVIDIDAGGNYVSSTSFPNGWWHTKADPFIAQDTWDFVAIDPYDQGRNPTDFTPKGWLDVNTSIAAGTGGRRVGYGPLFNISGSRTKIYAWTNFLAWCKHKVRPVWNPGAGHEGIPWAVGELGSHHTQSPSPAMLPEYGQVETSTTNADQRNGLQGDAMLDLFDQLTSWGSTVSHRCVGICWWDASIARGLGTATPNGFWVLQDNTVTRSDGSTPSGSPRNRSALDTWNSLIASSDALLNGYYGTNSITSPYYQVSRRIGTSWVPHTVKRLNPDGVTWDNYRIADPTAPQDLPFGWDHGNWDAGNWDDDN